MIERDLQTHINSDLKKMGIKYIHIEKGRYNKSKIHRKGIPDLLIFPGEKVYFLELKMPGKQLSEDQILFQQWAMQMKYPFMVIRSKLEWDIWKLEFLNDGNKTQGNPQGYRDT